MVRMQAIVATVGFITVAIFAGGCRGGRAAVKTASPMADLIHYELAVYYLPQAPQDPMKSLAELVKRDFPKVKVLDQPVDKPTGICIIPVVERDVAKNYTPPSVKELAYRGHGLTNTQAEALQNSQQALILDFGYPKSEVWSGLRAANNLVLRLARDAHGLIWDASTRGVFTPDEWEASRVRTWTEDKPDVSDQVSGDCCQNGEFARSITMGMAKLGLPDVVVVGFPWSSSRSISGLQRALIQLMAEGVKLPDNGEFDLDIRSIKNVKLRDALVASFVGKASGKARLHLVEGARDEGDTENRLLEIRFDRYAGPDLQSRQDEMLSGCFGTEDSVTQVRDSADLAAASRSAKQKLPTLRGAFQKGQEPGEVILVKAPFDVPGGGREWMWVEVTSWQGTRIKGTLQNDPEKVPNLHAGQVVTVSQNDVFDYIRRRADGTEEGNETGKIMLRQAGGK